MSAPDDADQMVLGRMSTQARLFGRAVDRLAVERRLDTVAREALPAAMSEALAAALHGQDGVVRIDTIDLAFAIDRRALDGGELAARWAAQVGAAIAERLRRPAGPGLARFASHAQFAAAYVEHRFAIAPHPGFAFADFAPLSHLTPGEAAVELVAARPVYFAAIASEGRRLGRPAWLADRLGHADAASLLDRLFADGQLPPAPGSAMFREMIANAPATWRSHRGAHAALSLALAQLAGAAIPDARQVLVTLALAQVTAALETVAREAPAKLRDIASGDTEILAEAAQGVAELRPLAALLAGLMADKQWRRLAAAMAKAMAPASPQREASAHDVVDGKPARRPAPPPTLRTAFAGLALVLPVLRDMRLPERLHPAQLRALLVALIAPDEALQEAAEMLASFLIPLHNPDPPPPWPALPGTVEAPASAAGWSACILDGFAERLPGLQASTAAYLRRQFLHRGGALSIEDKSLVARIERPPLAMVLTMAGMTGDLGPLPWLDRPLRIELA